MRSESPDGERRFVYIRCLAHGFKKRGPSLFDPAQSGQTKLRIAEIKLELVFVTTTCEAIMPSLLWRFFTAECTETKRGAARRVLRRSLSELGPAPLVWIQT